MLISASIIKNPRKLRRCEECGKLIAGKTLRLYGCAETGDIPYVIYMHPDCSLWDHPKILAALSAAQRAVDNSVSDERPVDK